MMSEQTALLQKAHDSVRGAKLMWEKGLKEK